MMHIHPISPAMPALHSRTQSLEQDEDASVGTPESLGSPSSGNEQYAVSDGLQSSSPCIGPLSEVLWNERVDHVVQTHGDTTDCARNVVDGPAICGIRPEVSNRPHTLRLLRVSSQRLSDEAHTMPPAPRAASLEAEFIGFDPGEQYVPWGAMSPSSISTDLDVGDNAEAVLPHDDATCELKRKRPVDDASCGASTQAGDAATKRLRQMQ